MKDLMPKIEITLANEWNFLYFFGALINSIQPLEISQFVNVFN
jgi:hypothetical protein